MGYNRGYRRILILDHPMTYYTVFCILLAFINYRVIKKGWRVKHAYNGALHLACLFLIWHYYDLKLMLASAFMAKIVFDVTLNLLRKLPVGYISPKPKSIIDRVEKACFKNGVTAKLFYLLCFALLSVI